MEDSSRIYNELCHETSAIWYISDTYGSKVMVKMPSTVIKAVVKGCRVEFLFGIDRSNDPHIFHIGAKFYDDPVNYQSIICTQRFLFEHYSIAKIMNLAEVQIQFYNELNACQAFGTLKFKEKDRHDILCLLGNPKKLYAGAFYDTMNWSLDCFEFNVGIDTNLENMEQPRELETLIIEANISGQKTMKNYFYSDGINVELSIDDKDEGNTLEDEVFITMASLFGKDVYKGVRIPYKNSTRELTDKVEPN